MICKKCNREVEDDSKFCPLCGADLNDVDVSGEEHGYQSVDVHQPNPQNNYYNNANNGSNGQNGYSNGYNNNGYNNGQNGYNNNGYNNNNFNQKSSATVPLVFGIVGIILCILNLFIPFVHLIGIGLGAAGVTMAQKSIKNKEKIAAVALVLCVIAIILGIVDIAIGVIFS